MKIPNGLQQHALFQMDGRTWIEIYFTPDDPKKQKRYELMQEKGYMTLIPRDKLAELVASVR